MTEHRFCSLWPENCDPPKILLRGLLQNTLRSAKCLLAELSNFFIFIVFRFSSKICQFFEQFVQKWFENGHHFSIKLFESYFVHNIVLYKTTFIHVSSFGKISHVYRFSKKKFQLGFTSSNFFFHFSKTKLIILNFYLYTSNI